MSLASQFRIGDQAEYLAQYFFSYLGATILTPRQEDHGFDLQCVIRDEGLYLPEMKNACCVQIKHGDPQTVSFGGRTASSKTNDGNWRKNQVTWLLDLKTPFLLGFVDLKKQTIKLYQSSSLWLLQVQASAAEELPYQISLIPESKGVSMPKGRKNPALKNRNEDFGDRKIWKVTLGKPLVVLNLRKLRNDGQRRVIKYRLNSYIELENMNRTFRQMGMPWATWICKINWDRKPFRKAWIFEDEMPALASDHINCSLGPYLISLIAKLKSDGKDDAYKLAIELFHLLKCDFKEIPPSFGHAVDYEAILNTSIPTTVNSTLLSGDC